MQAHYCNLFHPHTTASDLSPHLDTLQYPLQPFTIEEVEKALNTLHYNRSPGPSWIISEYLRLPSSGLIIPLLTTLFNQFSTSGLPTS